MLYIIAFKSLGIFPLDKNWINKEENAKRLTLTQSFAEKYSAENKLQRITAPFISQQSKRLDCLGFIDYPAGINIQ